VAGQKISIQPSDRTIGVHCQDNGLRSSTANRELLAMYNLVFSHLSVKTMDAERINSISYKLDDLAQRADELRRYL
jgi:hypothetical protein